MAKKKTIYSEEQLQGAAPKPDSILKKAGRAAVGGISAVANVLDLPGSMVRDTIGGQNPFDQLLSPFRSDNRLTGRDLARQAGLAGRKDTWGNFGGGLAAEVALDPLTYLTLGGSAVGKLGKVAKAAGVHGDTAASIFTKAMGGAPGQYGKRQARLGLTGDMIKQYAPEQWLKMEGVAKRQGVDLTGIMQEPLGGLAKFWPTGSVLGTGRSAQRVAGLMDDAGDAVRNFRIPGTNVRPIGDVANLFNQRTLGATNRGAMQRAGKLLDDRTAVRAGVRQQVARLAHERQRLNITPEQFDEWLDFPQNAPTYAQPVVAEARQLFEGLPQQYKEWGGVLDDVNEQMRFAGSDTRYKPRHILDNLLQNFRGKTRPFSGFTQSSMERWDWTKGVQGGDAVLRDMAKFVHGLRQQGIVKVDDIATELESQFGQHFHPVFISNKDFRAIQKTKKLRQQVTNIQDLQNFMAANIAPGKVLKVGGKKIQLRDTFTSAAKSFGRMSDEALEHGVWGNDPLVDIAQSTVQSHEALESVKNTVTHLAEKFKSNRAAFAKSEGSVPLGELLAGNKRKGVKGLGMTAGDHRNGAARKFIQLATGRDISLMKKKDAMKAIRYFKNLHVDAETANFLRQMNTEFTAPEAVNGMVKLWDSLTAFTKSLFTTADFIRFNARNFPGGQFNNLMAEQASAEGVKAGLDLATKGVIQGSSELPIVKQIAAQRGMSQVDDQAASKILAELAYAYEVTGHAGTGNPTHTQHLGGTLDDITSDIPGQKPFSLGGLGQTLKGRPGAWNPKNWRVRGVLGAQETTMPWMRAGEQVGDFTEHMIRFPAFYTLLKQGMDPQEAARMVGEAAVNYQNKHYTKFEQQVMQRLFLFYKFFRGQLPFTLRMLAENPGGRLANVLRSVNRSRDEEELIPDWIKETASIPVGQAEDGTKRYITGLGLPFEDPIQFASPSGQNLMLEGASRLNPLIKGPLEYMTGQSFFQKGGPYGGRPLEDLDPPLGRTLANIGELMGVRDSKAPVRYPGSGVVEHILANSPLSSALTKARTITDPRKSIPAKASNLLSGLKLTDVSPGTQDRELRSRVQRIERQLGAKNFTETFLPADVKANLSPLEQGQAAQLNVLKRLLDERSKTRKATKK